MIHLENGCSVTKAKVYKIATRCYGSQHWILSEWRQTLLDGNLDIQLRDDPDVRPFFCEHCGTYYTTLSGLLQHVESSTCPQSTEFGRMERLLYRIRRVLCDKVRG